MKMFPKGSGSVIGERPDSVIKKIEGANFAKVVSDELNRRQGTLAGEVLRLQNEGQTVEEISEALAIDPAEVRKCQDDFTASLPWRPGKGKKYRRRER